ncbi:MAG: UDP-N-acetylglucosamine 1-carboxyvinyltransferase [Lachnospiraceae bacterium]|nr:UDP-N-acetylglucosamine 1-carboxyvinyltransferase [Lachnospiraceae bacterium]
MSKFLIRSGHSLKGTVEIGGSKNAVLPILAACLLTSEECTIRAVPALSDAYAMLNILKELGANVNFNEKIGKVTISSAEINKFEEDYEIADKMRASFLVMGPLIARFGKAKLPLPGGCAIGTRPIDLHTKGFAAMGAKVKQEHGYVEVKAKKLTGAYIYLDFPSVGATENIMMAASLAEGITTIENAACEPEICDLADFINKMGGKIKGAGRSKIAIEGVESLKGANHKIIPDRIEAGTFMVASAITGGDILIKNVVLNHVSSIVSKLSEANISCTEEEGGIRVFSSGGIAPINIKTMPYPGFPTDMQAPIMSLLSLSKGTSIITETIFENRFLHASELKRMGADIKIDSRFAVIKGVKKLTGTQVKATDLRAGAALILSALAAEGETEISDIYHIERGYSNIDKKLKDLGADMEKIE